MKMNRTCGSLCGLAIAAVITMPGTTAAAVASYSPPSGSITGIVTDASTGLPLANDCDLTIIVRYADWMVPPSSDPYAVHPDYAEGSGPYAVKRFTGCLDAVGRYSIAGLPTDRYFVEAVDASQTYYDQYVPQDDSPPTSDNYRPATVSVTNGQQTSVNVALLRGGSIQGTITAAATGAPMANDCHVRIEASWPTGGTFRPDYMVPCTDGNGQFRIPDVEPGDYGVGAWKTGYISQGQSLTVTAGETSTFNAALVRAGRIRAVFKSAVDGSIISRARAIVTVKSPANRFRWIASNIANLSHRGVIVVRDVPPGTWRVNGGLESTYHHYYWAGRRKGPAGIGRRVHPDVIVQPGATTTVTVRLFPFERAESPPPAPQPKKVPAPTKPPTGAISGFVYDEQTGDKLVGNCDLHITAYRLVWPAPYDEQELTPVKTWTGCIDANGAYRIGGLPTGKGAASQYSVKVVDPTLQYGARYFGNTEDDYDAQLVTVSPHQTTSSVDVALPELGTVSGTVYDIETGEPIGNFCGLTVAIGEVPAPALCTDANGGYTVRGVDAGAIAVDFQAATTYERHKWMSGQTFQLGHGENRTGIDVYLVARPGA